MEIVLAVVWIVSVVVSGLRRRFILGGLGLLAPFSLLLNLGEAPLVLLEVMLWLGIASPIVGALFPSRIDLGPLRR